MPSGIDLVKEPWHVTSSKISRSHAEVDSPSLPLRIIVLYVIIKAFGSEGTSWERERKKTSETLLSTSLTGVRLPVERAGNNLIHRRIGVCCNEHVDRVVKLTIFGITSKNYFILFLFA